MHDVNPASALFLHINLLNKMAVLFKRGAADEVLRRRAPKFVPHIQNASGALDRISLSVRCSQQLQAVKTIAESLDVQTEIKA
jgi:hypothetical protein